MTAKPIDQWASSDVLAAVVDVEIAALLRRSLSKEEALLALAARRELEDRMRRHCADLNPACDGRILAWPGSLGFVSKRALLMPYDREEDRHGKDERDHGCRDVRGWNIDLHDWLLCGELGGRTVHFDGVLGGPRRERPSQRTSCTASRVRDSRSPSTPSWPSRETGTHRRKARPAMRAVLRGRRGSPLYGFLSLDQISQPEHLQEPCGQPRWGAEGQIVPLANQQLLSVGQGPDDSSVDECRLGEINNHIAAS
jgi:hypothetical protein